MQKAELMFFILLYRYHVDYQSPEYYAGVTRLTSCVRRSFLALCTSPRLTLSFVRIHPAFPSCLITRPSSLVHRHSNLVPLCGFGTMFCAHKAPRPYLPTSRATRINLQQSTPMVSP